MLELISDESGEGKWWMWGVGGRCVCVCIGAPRYVIKIENDKLICPSRKPSKCNNNDNNKMLLFKCSCKPRGLHNRKLVCKHAKYTEQISIFSNGTSMPMRECRFDLANIALDCNKTFVCVLGFGAGRRKNGLGILWSFLKKHTTFIKKLRFYYIIEIRCFPTELQLSSPIQIQITECFKSLEILAMSIIRPKLM